MHGEYNVKYKICISQNTIIFLENRFYVPKRATCFDLYIGHIQAHTIPKAHIEEDNLYQSISIYVRNNFRF